MGEALRSARGRAQGYTLHFTCMANVGSLTLRIDSFTHFPFGLMIFL